MPHKPTIPPASHSVPIALVVLLLTLINSPLFASDTGVAHDMSVEILPDSGEIRVSDTLRMSARRTVVEFVLNAGLEVHGSDADVQILATSDDGLRKAYRVTLQTPDRVVKLHYHGRPVFSARRGHGDMPQGVIAHQGVYLDAASAWYPQLADPIDAMTMQVTLPEGWLAVSTGRYENRAGRVTWTSAEPHDGLYLIAGRFSRHARQHGDTTLSVWLLDDDPALATRYLDHIGDYVDHYSRLIGAYPYAKFAVVENPWQTGYGMPSFTLLGSRVLRLPFILTSSLPHEILHNWWGNGVWVDYARGNWSEGLTAYLADHWMQEREGKGDQYRLKALQRYSNYAAQGADMALREFVSRHGEASQSVGYSKSLMLFHMLREAIGDAAFIDGLRRLWTQHRYQRIGFADALDSIAGDTPELKARLAAWLDSTGAPDLAITSARIEADAQGWLLHLVITQRQAALFDFDLPLAVTSAAAPQAQLRRVRIQQRSTTQALRFSERPLRLDIDPYYDVMRVLDPTEQPPALNRLFGSPRAWLVLPRAANPAMYAAWSQLADTWSRRYPGLKTIDDSDAAALDDAAEVVLLGWDNALLDTYAARFTREQQRLDPDGVEIDGQRTAAAGVVLVESDATGRTSGFIGAASPDLVAALARKLPHYGSYGRLLFDAEGNNRRKDTLAARHSQLTRQFDGQAVALQLPPRRPLGATEN